MDKLEWQIFIMSNATMVLSYWGIPNLWQKMNAAQTSFVAKLYWVPLGLMIMGIVFALCAWYVIINKLIGYTDKN